MTNEALVSMSGSLLESITDERDGLREENARMRDVLGIVESVAALLVRAVEAGAQPNTLVAGNTFLSALAADAQRTR
jgi:hypothetical protein